MNNRVHVSIIAIAIFNFSWLTLGWLSPSWRTASDGLKSAHMAGFDVFLVMALTALLLCLGIVQLFRQPTQGNATHRIVDVLIVSAWVITFVSIVVRNLSAILAGYAPGCCLDAELFRSSRRRAEVIDGFLE